MSDIELAISYLLQKPDLLNNHRAKYLLRTLIQRVSLLATKEPLETTNKSLTKREENLLFFIKLAKSLSSQFFNIPKGIPVIDLYHTHALFISAPSIQKFRKENAASIAWLKKLKYWPAGAAAPTDEYREAFLKAKKEQTTIPDYATFISEFEELLFQLPRRLKYKNTEYLEILSSALEQLKAADSLFFPLREFDEETVIAAFNAEFDQKSISGWSEFTYELPGYDWERDGLGEDDLVIPPPSDPAMVLQRLKSQVVDKKTARMEFLIAELRKRLSSVIEESVDELYRRAAGVAPPVGESSESEVSTSDVDSEVLEEEGEMSKPENRKKKSRKLELPLGFDGKPIPYWVYKLHGLHEKFECEVCAGETFQGRRRFELHFDESTHRENLRKLGIIKNFLDYRFLDKIEDVLKLAQHLQTSQKLFIPQ